MSWEECGCGLIRVRRAVHNPPSAMLRNGMAGSGRIAPASVFASNVCKGTPSRIEQTLDAVHAALELLLLHRCRKTLLTTLVVDDAVCCGDARTVQFGCGDVVVGAHVMIRDKLLIVPHCFHRWCRNGCRGLFQGSGTVAGWHWCCCLQGGQHEYGFDGWLSGDRRC